MAAAAPVGGVELTNLTMKWMDKAQKLDRARFNDILDRLANGHRSYALSKLLKGCKHPIFESKFDTGKRLLWTKLRHPSASLELSSCPHARTHIRTRVQHSHMLAHARTFLHILAHSCTSTRPHVHTSTHPHIHTSTHPHIHTFIHSHDSFFCMQTYWGW